MLKFRRAFIEITNVCNLSCPFCARSVRRPCVMPPEMFEQIAAQVRPLAGMLSLHVLGEPLTHPQFPEIIKCCSRLQMPVNLVTNGTLLDRFGEDIFAEPCFSQISVSLHALACLDEKARAERLAFFAAFADKFRRRFIISFRLRGDWQKPFEREVLAALLGFFGTDENTRDRRGALKLAENVYLNSGEFFKWPSGGAPRAEKNGCLGLRHNFAVLCTGEVVPCCVDFDAALSVGNIKDGPLAEILSSPSAVALRDAIAGKTSMPAYCQACGFRAPS